MELSETIEADLDPRTEWLCWSENARSFLVGDADRAVAVAPDGGVSALAASGLPVILPVPADLHDSLAGQPRHGFHFLNSADYAGLRGHPGIANMLAFGPNGTPLRHPAAGAVLGLTGGALRRLGTPAEEFPVLEETRTRGKTALAFAAHPTEPVIAYGDNYGGLFLQELSAAGFGKARKLEAQPRAVNDLLFIDGGARLVAGGMGFLASYAWNEGRPAKEHEVSIAVRELVWSPVDRILTVNQGLQGISRYRVDAAGFTRLDHAKLAWAVDRLAVAGSGAILALEKYAQWPARVKAHLLRPY